MWHADVFLPNGKILPFDFLAGELIIGRAPDCDLMLDDTSVSRYHAKVIVTGAGAQILDMDSANGVVVNGEAVYAQKALRSGDQVVLGRIKLTFSTADVEAENTAGEFLSSLSAASPKSAPRKPAPVEVTRISSAIPDGLSSTGGIETTKIKAVSSPGGMNLDYAGLALGGMQSHKLYVYLGRQPAVYPLGKKQLTVGRAEDNDIVIEHSSVSRSHAKIIPSGNSRILQDLGSGNGTEINGQSIRRRYLCPGDEIYFGTVPARFSVKDEGPLELKKIKKTQSSKSSIPVLKLLLIAVIVILALLFLSNYFTLIVTKITDYLGG